MSTSLFAKPKNIRGLSLAEIILAFGLLALMFLTVAFLYAQLLKSSAKASNTAVGVAFAERVMEQTLAGGSAPLATANLAEGLYSVDETSQTQFFYRVEVERLDARPKVSTEGYVVRVPVWWWSNAPGESRQGQGKQSFVLERYYTPEIGAP